MYIVGASELLQLSSQKYVWVLINRRVQPPKQGDQLLRQDVAPQDFETLKNI